MCSNHQWSGCIMKMILLTALAGTLTASHEVNHNNDALRWPLRFHQSPWLERNFLIRNEPSTAYTEVDQTRPKCDENAQQDYGRSASSTCHSEGECSFQQSPSCQREIAKRRFDRRHETASIGKILSHEYENPSTRILPNKDG